ncbi:MAG: ATP-binding cassette domain-containing protein [Peptococcaceae bacterium]|nr:ATP-binding cassette domain-containing protein [Peptococcaceae bacterium]
MLFNFQDITYTLGPDKSRQISVSGSLNPGEVMVARGPSGAGKSTFFRVIARLQSCLSGEVFLNGRSWMQIPGTIWRSSVHYLAQKPALFDGTVAGNLAKPFEISQNNKKKFDVELAKSIMQQLLLAPTLWEQDAKTLSGGEAARVTFLRALLLEPAVLLLDEPTAALDDESKKAFYAVLSNWLKNSDRAAFLISHTNDYEGLGMITFLDIEPKGGVI